MVFSSSGADFQGSEKFSFDSAPGFDSIFKMSHKEQAHKGQDKVELHKSATS